MPKASKKLLLQRKDSKGTIELQYESAYSWRHIRISFYGPRGAHFWTHHVYVNQVEDFLELMKPLIGMPKTTILAVTELVRLQVNTVCRQTEALALNAEELSVAVALLHHNFTKSSAQQFKDDPAIVAPTGDGDADASPSSV